MQRWLWPVTWFCFNMPWTHTPHIEWLGFSRLFCSRYGLTTWFSVHYSRMNFILVLMCLFVNYPNPHHSCHSVGPAFFLMFDVGCPLEPKEEVGSLPTSRHWVPQIGLSLGGTPAGLRSFGENGAPCNPKTPGGVEMFLGDERRLVFVWSLFWGV